MTISEVQILVAQARSEANNPAFKVGAHIVPKDDRMSVNTSWLGPSRGVIGIFPSVSSMRS